MSSTSFQRLARLSEFSTISSSSDFFVVVDRHRERVRLLEDHADAAAEVDRVDAGAVDVLAVEEHLPLDPRARDEVVHAVEAAQERRLPAARRPDERGDVVPGDPDGDVPEGLEVPVVEVQVGDGELVGALDRRRGRARQMLGELCTHPCILLFLRTM
jgi:hypothetical protein